ncbi:MAG: hypothetical protein WDO69_03225 [Pseudomonadota bacterium]
MDQLLWRPALLGHEAFVGIDGQQRRFHNGPPRAGFSLVRG